MPPRERSTRRRFKRSAPRRRQGRRTRSLTVRTRIVLTLTVLTILALTLSGMVAYLLQRERVDQDLDATLLRTTQEYSEIIGAMSDQTADGQALDVYDVVFDAMSTEVPAENEGTLGFVEGQATLRQPGGLDVSADQELVDYLTTQVASDVGMLSSVTTSTSTYRYAILPIEVAAGDGTMASGSIVVAFDRSAEMLGVNQSFQTYALVAAGSVVVMAVVASIVSGRLLAPLRELRETAATISDTDLSKRITVRGRDDVSELGSTFNEMIDRLEQSFSSQRQLLDDAGHELRTPITVVRGHLELMDPNDPEDAAETRTMAVSELDRMHRLTDDLVLLAKTEQPDFVVRRPTSVGKLTDSVLDQARTLGKRRWRVDQRLEATADLDAQRLTQAMLQLCANAVKFSDEGSTIAVGSAIAPPPPPQETSADGSGRSPVPPPPPSIRLWVRDEGWGISEADQAHIFDRFSRSTDPRQRAKEGAGLGLAIVSGIASAHSGKIWVTSQVGSGSMFVMEIPTVQLDVADSSDHDVPGPPENNASESATPEQ